MVEQILANTPKWVFIVFVVLAVYGWTQLKDRALNATRVAVLPTIMTFLSIGGVLSSFGASAQTLGLWLAGFVTAVVLNRFIGSPGGVRYDAATRLFHVPGSWTPMLLMMAIFCAKYVVGATEAMRPDVARSATFAMVLSGVFGLLSGVFFARFLKIRASASVPAAAEPQPAESPEAVRSAS